MNGFMEKSDLTDEKNQTMKKRISFLEEAGAATLHELKRILRDPGAVLILLLAVIAYPVIYSVAYQGEVLRDLPIAIVDRSNSMMSRTFSRMADETDELEVFAEPESMKAAERLFYDGEVKGIVLIEKEFQKNINAGNPAVLKVFADGSYFLFYKQVLSGVMYSGGTLGAGIEIQRLMASGEHHEQAKVSRDPVSLKLKTLHNPFGGYGAFVMPGLMIVIFQQTLLVGLGMLGGTTAEHRNPYFREPSHQTTQTIMAYVSGRSVAYLLLYILTGTIIFVWAYNWFSFPDNGSLWNAFILFVPFIMANTFLGMAIATLFKHREEAFLFIVFLSPVVLFLSGISWPAEAIPPFLYSIGHLFPSGYMVPAYLRVRTMGASVGEVSYELSGMLIQTAIYFLLAVWALKIRFRSIEKDVPEQEIA